MYVVKRNGSSEEVQFDKITKRIKNLCYGLNEKYVEPVSAACVRCCVCVCVLCCLSRCIVCVWVGGFGVVVLLLCCATGALRGWSTGAQYPSRARQCPL